MFGDNLKRWIAKEEFGSVEKLLSRFECKECRTADAPVKVKKPKKVRNTDEGSITVKGNSAESYMTVEDMEDRKDKVRATLPTFNPDAKPAKIDFNDAEQVAELTRGACQRPDIYLDAGCKYCPLVQYCACVSKDLKKDVINDGRTSSRKRK
jgi:hypothetical protein